MKRRVLKGLTAAMVLASSATASAASQSGPIEHVTNSPSSTGGHVVIEGNRLYMGMYGAGLRIFDITKPDAPAEIGRWTPPEAGNPNPVADGPPDAAVFDGRHIAVVNGTDRGTGGLPAGTTDNAYFLDTTDPANPELLWMFNGAEDGESHNGDIVDSRRIWLPSGGSAENGLRIYDLQPLLRSPAAAPAVIFRGDPTQMWEASPHRGDREVGPEFVGTHDITIYPDFEVNGSKRDIALLADGGAYLNDAGNTGSLFVIDITNPRAPVVLLRWMHEMTEGHKPIRYFHEAQFLHGDPSIVILTDEDLHNGCTAGGVTALRITPDLTSATELSEWFIADQQPAGTAFGPVCSVHVFNSHGHLAYFGSYNAGLQVVDYSNPSDPKLMAHDQQPGANSWGAEYYRDGLVYVGDFGGRGLDVFRYTGPIPDLTVQAPKREDSGQLAATVVNQGKFISGAVPFEFRDGNEVIARATVPPLAPGADHRVQVPLNSRGTGGERTITAVADPADRLDESDEQNNSASAAIKFSGPGAGAGAGAGAETPLSASLKLQRMRLRRAIRSGLALRVTCSRACAGRITLRVDRRVARKLRLGRKARTLGRATFALPEKGTKAVRVRLDRRSRRALRRARAVKLTATATVREPGSSKTVTVKRVARLRR